jgi:hypothetical protein
MACAENVPASGEQHTANLRIDSSIFKDFLS